MRSAASWGVASLSTLSLPVALLLGTVLSSTAAAQAPVPAGSPIGNVGSPADPQTSPSQTSPSPNDGGQPSSSPDQQPAAQEPTSNDQGSMFVFKKQVQEVVLHATVVDEQGHLVTGLDKSAFSISENGT